MAYISYDKLWLSELYNYVSAKDRFQDNSFNQLKLTVKDTYMKDEKLTTKLDPSDDTDEKTEAYSDENLSKTESHIS